MLFIISHYAALRQLKAIYHFLLSTVTRRKRAHARNGVVFSEALRLNGSWAGVPSWKTEKSRLTLIPSAHRQKRSLKNANSRGDDVKTRDADDPIPK